MHLCIAFLGFFKPYFYAVFLYFFCLMMFSETSRLVTREILVLVYLWFIQSFRLSLFLTIFLVFYFNQYYTFRCLQVGIPNVRRWCYALLSLFSWTIRYFSPIHLQFSFVSSCLILDHLAQGQVKGCYYLRLTATSHLLNKAPS